MERFIELGGKCFNASNIKAFWCEPSLLSKKDTLHIELQDGRKEKIVAGMENAFFDLEGRDHIMQVIPVTEKLYAVYGDDGSGYNAYPVHYLALCADGKIRELQQKDGYFEFCNAVEDYAGCFYDYQLAEAEIDFPNLAIHERGVGK